MAVRILIIDDSQLVHRICRLTLMPLKDCVILDAMNGMEGIEILLREEKIDLILLDINMPIMNGLQFLEKLKADPRLSKIPVIVVSTESKDSDIERAMKLGALNYVKKAKSEELYNIVSNALDHVHATAVNADGAR